MGRKLLFNPERAAKFVEAVLRGAVVEAAAVVVGWKQRTAYEYLARGRSALESKGLDPRCATPDEVKQVAAKDYEYAVFCAGYDRAVAGSEFELLKRIVEEGRTDWKPCAWLLERRFPERYSRNRKVGAEMALVVAQSERAQVETELAKLQLEAYKKGGSTGRVMLPADLLTTMQTDDPALAKQLVEFMAKNGLHVMQRANLTSGVSQADMAEVSPSETCH